MTERVAIGPEHSRGRKGSCPSITTPLPSLGKEATGQGWAPGFWGHITRLAKERPSRVHPPHPLHPSSRAQILGHPATNSHSGPYSLNPHSCVADPNAVLHAHGSLTRSVTLPSAVLTGPTPLTSCKAIHQLGRNSSRSPNKCFLSADDVPGSAAEAIHRSAHRSASKRSKRTRTQGVAGPITEGSSGRALPGPWLQGSSRNALVKNQIRADPV